jgi:hypothetical protein
MMRIRFIRAFLPIIALILPILSVSMANEVINFQCNGLEPENDYFVSIHYSIDHRSLVELNNHIDCKIVNVSFSGIDCLFQTKYDGSFSRITPNIVRVDNTSTLVSLITEALPAYDSSVPIHLLKETFLI